MASSDPLLVKQRQELEDQLSALDTMNRRLEDAKKGVVKEKALRKPDMYDRVTNKEGDRQLTSVMAAPAKAFAGAFGRLNGEQVYHDTLMRIETARGRDRKLEGYYREAAKIFTLIAYRAGSDRKTEFGNKKLVADGQDTYVTAFKTGGIDSALNALDTKPSAIYQGNVYSWLRPISREYVRWLDASSKSKSSQIDAWKDYVANELAQRATNVYMNKVTAPKNILTPAMIEGRTKSAVTNALDAYPNKDLEATYNFYKKAVLSYNKARSDIRAGGASYALKDARSELDVLTKLIKRTFHGRGTSRVISVLNEAKKVLATKNVTGYDIEAAVVLIYDAFGGLVPFSHLEATNPTASSLGSLFDKADELAKTQNTVFDTFGMSPRAAREEEEVRESIRPTGSIETTSVRLIRTGDMQKAVKKILQNIMIAYDEVFGLLDISTVTAPAVDRGKVSPAFVQFADKEIWNLIENVKSDIGRVEPTRTNQSALTEGVAYIFKKVLQNKDFAYGSVAFESDRLKIGRGEITNALADSAKNNIYIKIAGDRQPKYDNSMARGALDVFERAAPMNRSQYDNGAMILNDLGREISNTISSLSTQASLANIRMRANPMGVSNPYVQGGISLAGTHAVTSAGHALLNPKFGSMKSHMVNTLPSAVVGAYGVQKIRNGESSEGTAILSGAVAHLVARYAMSHPKLRFSNNPAIRYGLQSWINGEARLAQDPSMGYCGLYEFKCDYVNEKSMKKVIEVVTQNCPLSSFILGVQAGMNGLAVDQTKTMDHYAGWGTEEFVNTVIFKKAGSSVKALDALMVGGVFAKLSASVDCGATLVGAGTAITDDIDTPAEIVAHFGSTLKMLGSVFMHADKIAPLLPQSFLALDRKALENTIKDLKSLSMKDYVGEIKAFGTSVYNKYNTPPAPVPVEAPAADTTPDTVNLYRRPAPMGKFIMEPGYNFKAYSGADATPTLVPPPHQTSGSGYQQLENAIMRAKVLTPDEIKHECVENLLDVAIIRAKPSMADKIESHGLGQSLGKSRSNPATDLVALNLEVLGAQGVEPVAPARQHSVPQGALEYPQIEHAQNIEVSPRGLFNRGLFTPQFSG